MTASDHATKPFRNTLRKRGHPYMTLGPSGIGGLRMMCWPAGRLATISGNKGYENIDARSSAAGLNVVSVKRGEKAWTVTVDNQQSTFCPGRGTQPNRAAVLTCERGEI